MKSSVPRAQVAQVPCPFLEKMQFLVRGGRRALTKNSVFNQKRSPALPHLEKTQFLVRGGRCFSCSCSCSLSCSCFCSCSCSCNNKSKPMRIIKTKKQNATRNAKQQQTQPQKQPTKELAQTPKC